MLFLSPQPSLPPDGLREELSTRLCGDFSSVHLALCVARIDYLLLLFVMALGSFRPLPSDMSITRFPSYTL